jgi:hypothetical protein
MKTLADNNQKKWPVILSIPMFIILGIVLWKYAIWTLGFIQEYVGGWGMILTLPLSFRYIIIPVAEMLWEWHDKKFY